MLVISQFTHAAPATRVYWHVWRGGVVLRDELVDATGLSAASVSRAVSALVKAELVQPRPDMARVGATGRPSIPVQLDTSRHAVIGVHVGRTRVTVAMADLRGRVLRSVELLTPSRILDLPGEVLIAVAGIEPTDRQIVSAAVVGAWADLGINADRLAEQLTECLQVAVVTQDHITAAAAAEHAADGQAADAVTAYVYARDTIGFAVVEQTTMGIAISRSSRLTHFPSGSDIACSCRAVGCLEASVSDLAVAQRAAGEGLLAEPDVTALYALADHGSVRARELLRDRGMRLGRAAAFVRDMLGVSRVVLMGQAFTAYQPARADVLDGFAQATSDGSVDVSFGHRGAELQAAAASIVALVPFSEDPMALIHAE